MLLRESDFSKEVFSSQFYRQKIIIRAFCFDSAVKYFLCFQSFISNDHDWEQINLLACFAKSSDTKFLLVEVAETKAVMLP